MFDIFEAHNKVRKAVIINEILDLASNTKTVEELVSMSTEDLYAYHQEIECQ